jgi:hypothetical protein
VTCNIADDAGMMIGPGGELIIRSKAYPFAAGVAVNIEMPDFLGQAQKPPAGGRWRITGLCALVRGNYTTGAGNSLRAMSLYENCALLQINDRWGPRINQVKGRTLGAVGFMDDVNHRLLGGALAVATANQLRNVAFYLPMHALWGQKWESETWWDWEDFYNGAWSWTWSGATLGDGAGTNQATVNAATNLRWYATLVAEPPAGGADHARGFKMRTILKEFNIPNAQWTVPLGKNVCVRYAWNDIGDVGAHTTAPATWTGSSLLDCEQARFTQIEGDALVEIYRMRRAPAQLFGAAADDINPFLDGTIQPIYTPRREESMLDLPRGDSLSIRTTQAFNVGSFVPGNNPTTVTSYIEDRPDAQQPPTSKGRVATVISTAYGAPVKSDPDNPVHALVEKKFVAASTADTAAAVSNVK